jgi:hypothetical protein
MSQLEPCHYGVGVSGDNAQSTLRLARWQAAWPDALQRWSRFAKLSHPIYCLQHVEAKRHGLSESFAMIRLNDQRIVIDLQRTEALALDQFAEQILAHEIGHHIYVPANLNAHLRSLARMRLSLIDQAARAPEMLNLYSDLLINDRLQRTLKLDMVSIFQHLVNQEDPSKPQAKVWAMYLRIYEHLWKLPTNTLCRRALNEMEQGDAILGARLIRHYAHDWLAGVMGFGFLMYPYLLEDDGAETIQIWLDTRDAGSGADCSEISLIDLADELLDGVHPALDPALTGEVIEIGGAITLDTSSQSSGRGQALEPFQLGELLAAAGLRVDVARMTVQYYRERALPHLLPFPTQKKKPSSELLPEGTELWELSDSLEAIDWFQTLMLSSQPIPGVSTVQRSYGSFELDPEKAEPIDLDLYIDSSGSMPNPAQSVSYPALAGTILAISALRAGGSVKVTLWSGKKQVITTAGFIRDEFEVLKVVVAHLGGGTQFPLPNLRESYQHRHADRKTGLERDRHILVVSDEGAATMFMFPDEKGTSGFEVSNTALARARAGGTLALQLPPNWEQQAKQVGGYWPESFYALQQAREHGWVIERVGSQQELVEFAARFARRAFV